jgi:hypothetical protein
MLPESARCKEGPVETLRTGFREKRKGIGNRELSTQGHQQKVYQLTEIGFFTEAPGQVGQRIQGQGLLVHAGGFSGA